MVARGYLVPPAAHFESGKLQIRRGLLTLESLRRLSLPSKPAWMPSNFFVVLNHRLFLQPASALTEISCFDPNVFPRQ